MQPTELAGQAIAPPPPLRFLLVSPAESNVEIGSGQIVPMKFTLERHLIDSAVNLSVGPLPPGITATVSPRSLPASATSQEFTVTLTAAPNVAPVVATIEVTATGAAQPAKVALNAKAVGQVRPTYQLLTVVYAPPGTNGGRSSSKVDYATGSTTGTTTSVSSSFKEGVAVNASASISLAGLVNLGSSTDFTASQTNGETSSLNISKSSSYEISVSGPGEDGIDHGSDLFYLWLNPVLEVAIDADGLITWGVAVDGPTMLIQYVYAKWLQDPSLMPPGVAQALAAAGLTAADYAQILAADPFVSGNATIDPNRFVPTLVSFPYEPPPAASDVPPTSTYQQSSATTATETQQTQCQYGVSVTVSAGLQLFFSPKLDVTGSLEWTNTSTTAQSQTSTQSASVTVGGPAFGYTGPTDVLVYWDTVFSSFMFVFATGTPVAVGMLIDSAGKPVPNTELTLTSGGHTFTTFTAPDGGYRFYGAGPGPGTVSVGSQKFTVAVGPGEPSRTLQVNV